MTNIQSVLFYIAIFCFILIINYLITDKTKKRRLISCFLCFTLMTIVSGFRGVSVGTDTNQYVVMYNVISRSSFPFENIRFEIGYTIFVKLCTMISDDPLCLIFFSSLIMNLCIAICIYQNSNDICFSFLLSYIVMFVMNLNAMRQQMAICILLLFIKPLSENKYCKYILGCILSALFHRAAIVMIVLVFAPKLKIRIKYFAMFMVFSLLVITALKPVFTFFIEKTPYYYYIHTDFYQGAFLGGLYNLILPCCLIAFAFRFSLGKGFKYDAKAYYILPNKPVTKSDKIFLICSKNFTNENYLSGKKFVIKVKNNNKKEKQLDKICLFSLSLCLYAAVISIGFSIVSRIYSMFLFPVLILYSNLFSRGNKKQKLIILFVALVLFVIQGIYRPNWTGSFNYQLL